ncbi:MAG TPA: leucyl aminopeptidase [Actinobacteria bacterium]|nr:leucyl aminopeptidase [Actinomycetota bacterium]
MMEIVPGPPLAEVVADVLVVPILADGTSTPELTELETLVGGETIGAALDRAGFEGKVGEVVSFLTTGPVREVVFVGLGDEVTVDTLRQAAGSAARRVGKAAEVATTLHRFDLDGAAEAVALGWRLGAYRFDRYRSEPTTRRTERLFLVGGADGDGLARAEVLAEAVAWARDLVNEPAAAKSPARMAELAMELHPDVAAEVYDEAACAEEGFGGLLAVGAGSARPPRMVVLRYRPEGASSFVALVGKGIVFDSGGLSLKPPQAMEAMKTDMAGAAAVLAAVRAVARLGLPVELLAVTPFAENMPGGGAQRPGDVLTTYGGKTIEVLNTDAEGRLVLADALAYAAAAGPDVIVDLATLTGACKVALGPKIAGVFGNDEAIVDEVVAAARTAGESVWPLPLERSYRSMIDSTVADMKNTGERFGGAITAALLLAEFVEDRPWAHLDIAGPARADKAEHEVPKGGTGFGVRTLVEFVAGRAR